MDAETLAWVLWKPVLLTTFNSARHFTCSIQQHCELFDILQEVMLPPAPTPLHMVPGLPRMFLLLVSSSSFLWRVLKRLALVFCPSPTSQLSFIALVRVLTLLILRLSLERRLNSS